MRVADIRQLKEHKEAPWIVPVQHLSPSALSTLMRCPEQYRYAYILKIKSRPRVSMVLGTANHSTHEHTLTRKIAGQETPLKDALDFYRDEAWPRAVKRDGGKENIREWEVTTPDFAIERGSAMVAAWHEGVLPRVDPTAVEKEHRLQVEGLPVPLYGFVDIETENVAIDLKTTARKVKVLKPGWRLQGRVYQLFTEKAVAWHIVTTTKTPEAITPLEEPGLYQPISWEIREQTENMVRRLALMANTFMHIFGADNPWPTTGVVHDGCGWCGYQSRCVAWKGVELL